MEQLSRIEKKLDHFAEKIASIDKTLVRQEHLLAEYMRRVSAAEDELEAVKHGTRQERREFETRLEPLKQGYDRVKGFLAGLGVIALILTIANAGLNFYERAQKAPDRGGVKVEELPEVRPQPAKRPRR